MKKYNEVEGILYSHFEKIRLRDEYIESLRITRNLIAETQDDLQHCRFNLSTDLEGIDYSREKITTSIDNSSSMEKEMIRNETKLIRELKGYDEKRLELKRSIRKLQSDISDVSIILKRFTNEDIEIIEMRYKNKMSYRRIARKIPCDDKTVRSNKNRIVNELAKVL